MKLPRFQLVWCLTLFATSVITGYSQLEMLPENKPHQVFGGGPRSINLAWRNRGEQTVESTLSLRLYQTTSATGVLLSEKAWKNMQILPRQTILENARVDFPDVLAETRFLIQWIVGTNQVAGMSHVLVYPTNLLAELEPLAGGEAVGVYDPANQLKPLLTVLRVPSHDLMEDGLGKFNGKLAIIGPFESKAQVPQGLSKQVQTLAGNGVAVALVQPPPEKRGELRPSFYTVTIGKGVVVVVQAELVADLADRPQAQLNLLHVARLALHPESARLPVINSEP